MKLLMRDEAKGREHTIFVTIFSALMVMLAIVVMLMASATAISGVTLQLDENAVDILDKQVGNRAGYIQDQLQQAQELTDLSTYINETAQQMLDDETLSLKTLDSSSSDSLPLLLAAAPRMLETLRSKRITGIFLILNTHDFTDRTSGDRLPLCLITVKVKLHLVMLSLLQVRLTTHRLSSTSGLPQISYICTKNAKKHSNK